MTSRLAVLDDLVAELVHEISSTTAKRAPAELRSLVTEIGTGIVEAFFAPARCQIEAAGPTQADAWLTALSDLFAVDLTDSGSRRPVSSRNRSRAQWS